MSGTQNRKLLGAQEDFRGRTLRSFETLWAKLRYVASLIDEKGAYSHAGMERRHGTDAAREALATSHHELFHEALRETLPAQADQQALAEQEGDAEASPENLVPRSATQAERKHFKWLSAAISALMNR